MNKRYLLFLLAFPILLWSITALAEPRNSALEISLEQIFNTTHISSDAELQHINRRCKELGLALAFRKIDTGDEVEAYINVRGITIAIPHQLLSSVYSHLTFQDPYAKATAKVRTYGKNSLCPEEIAATEARAEKCLNAIQKLVNQKINPKAMPRIAVAGSGGGTRAAVAFAGLLNGLDKDGFFDAILYIAGLSGSTWTVAPYAAAEQDSFKDFYPIFIDRIIHGIMNKPEHEALEYLQKFLPVLTEFIIRKLIFKDIPNVIDIYGFCLAVNFLGENAAQDFLNTGLMALQKNVEKGQRPYPILTSIIPLGDTIHYDWVTISPYEVASDDLDAAAPAWAFGRSFDNGVSTNKAPFLPLGFYMGVCGSALSISFEELYEMYLNSIPQSLVHALQTLSQPNAFGESRVFPAIIRNYTYNMKNSPRATSNFNTLVDAGISINLPLPPLLNPDRAVDIIIICDASGDVINAPELLKAQAYAQAHNLPFPTIDYSNITNQAFSVFNDGPSSNAPIIIYVPMIRNTNYSATFIPQNNMGNGQFMNTGNFDYSLAQANLLAGLLEESAHELKNALLSALQSVIQRKS